MRAKLAIFALSTALLALPFSSHAEVLTIEEYIGSPLALEIANGIKSAIELKHAKADANREFSRARAAFYAELDKGVLGSPAERKFGQLLLAKDLYFLTMYVTEGMPASTKQLNALDTLTGGTVDGGISGFPADDFFAAWVRDVRSKLGATRNGQIIFVMNPVTLKRAIDATKDSYDRYRKARDRLEFKRWRSTRPLIVAKKADTPQARADTYINIVVAQAVDDALAKLPQEDPAKFRQEVDAWTQKLRQAIIDYESVPITPGTVSEYMNGTGYTKEAQNYFWAQLGSAKSLHGLAFVSAVSKALAATQDWQDLLHSGISLNAKPYRFEVALRGWLSIHRNPGGRESLKTVQYKAGRPAHLPMLPYVQVADLIDSGHLGYEPPLPKFHRYGTMPGEAGYVPISK